MTVRGRFGRLGLSGSAPAGAPPESGRLPLVHRLAMAYLLAPVAIWLLGWFHWWVGMPATALLAIGVGKALSGSWRWRRPSRTTVVLALAAGVWVMTTPAGGVFKVETGDWTMHRALLLDLARGGWPTYPVDHLHDVPPLLRYYLGWYMVPALLARWLGPAALNWAAPLWTWCGVALVLQLLARRLPTLRAALLAVAVLVFFSGMDVVELALREGVPDAARVIRDKLDPDWVVSRGEDRRLNFARTASSPMLLEYQSPMLTLQLTPQHFLPAALGTLLMLQLRRRRRFLEASGVVLAACLFWSSLLATGLLVLAGAMLLRNRKARHAANWRNVFVAVPLAALIALYLTSGAVDFERGWLWELYDDRVQLASDVLLMYATEFALLAALLWRLDRRVVRNPIFIAAVGMLLLAPWYYYGSREFSEWSVRFTIPALMVLACFAARAVVRRRSRPRTRPARGALLAVLAAGAVTVVWEVGLVTVVMHNPSILPYETVGTSLMIDAIPLWARQRATHSVPGRLAALLRHREPDEADKGTLLIRSAYEVYLRDNRLVYVGSHGCSPGEGQGGTRFYAHVYPADPQALSSGQAADDHERIVFDLNARRHYRGEGRCVAPVRLPHYEIARVEAGQAAPNGRRLWEAEAHLTPNPPAPAPGTGR